MTWEVVYFNQGVANEAKALPKKLKTKLYTITDRMIQHGPDLGLPHTKSFGSGLFEIRVKAQEGICRGFYCIEQRKIIILNVFIKKSQQTPKKEIELAKKRLKEVKNYGI